jgi:ferrous-iron efflux pump FieF
MTETHTSAFSATALANASAPRLMRLATGAATAMAVLLLAAKVYAYFHTHSVSLLTSLADSALDILASGLNFLAVRQALAPADAQHRFGHGKAEPLSALAQGAFIAGSAVLLGVEAASRFDKVEPVRDGDLGIAIMVLSTVATLVLVAFQRYVIKRSGSMAISADSLHYTGDLLLNVSVIVALVLSTRMGLTWADPVFGMAIAAFLLFNAARIGSAAVEALMDRELPESDRQKIIAVAKHHPRVRNVHELRTRSSGLQQFIQMHIVLDKSLTLLDAHRISDEVEAAVQADFPNADIIIHQDPEGVAEFHPPVGAAL